MNWIKHNKRFPTYKKSQLKFKNMTNEQHDPYAPLKQKPTPNWVHLLLHALNAIITSLINQL